MRPLLLALGLVCAVGCGASKQAAPADAPPAPGAEAPEATSLAEEGEANAELDTADDAARAFADAERQLDDMFQPADEPAPIVPDTSTTAQPGTAPPAPPRAEALAADRCTNACRALGSMRRSAARLCELAGQDDQRCSEVTARVQRAESRVRQSCPGCDAAHGE
jgi:hypothetical protein